MLKISVFVVDNIDVGNRAFNIFVMLVICHRRRKMINNRKPSLSQTPRDQVWTQRGGVRQKLNQFSEQTQSFDTKVPILSLDADIYNPELRNVPFLPIYYVFFSLYAMRF